MPNQPATQAHSFRIPEELWEELLRRADDEGETATEIVLRALRRYLRDY